jgi:hypothetical protein
MIKLYKFEPDRVLYWEAWETDKEIILHSGVLGERGKTRNVAVEAHEPSKIIADEAHKYHTDGYRELKEGEEQTLLVQYQVDGWGTAKDLDKR